MIETRDLWVRFGPVAAVRGLSLRAEAGGWTALIGPNGAGKTSALRALAGLVPFDGEVRIDDQDVRKLGRRALARLLAFVPQKPETPPKLTVAEYVLLGRTPHISLPRRRGGRDREAAARGLRRLDLEDFARASARLAQRRRAPARCPRARARAGGAGPASRRADDLARPRPPAARARARRRAARGRPHGRDDDARPHARRPVRRAGRPLDGARSSRRARRPTCSRAPNVAAHYGANVRVIEDESGVYVVPGAQPLD